MGEEGKRAKSTVGALVPRDGQTFQLACWRCMLHACSVALVAHCVERRGRNIISSGSLSKLVFDGMGCRGDSSSNTNYL